MALAIGIIGLPNVGKSTLFNALTLAGVPADNYPFCTKNHNIGLASVPDPRLYELQHILQPQETIPSAIRFVDIAGLVAGASQGEGMGNQFLGHVREVDALVHVVRLFADDNVSHVSATPDPLHDAQIVETELQLADLEIVERALQTAQKEKKGQVKDAAARVVLLEKLQQTLAQGRSVRTLDLSKEDKELLRGKVALVTDKPLIYVCNIGEEELETPEIPADFLTWAGQERVLALSAKIEAEIAELPAGERAEFFAAMGMRQSGLVELIQTGFRLLGLITFYTIANDKLRAWEIPAGTTAPAAAGKIHSDMQAGFIRAEVARYEDLKIHGSMKALRAQGCVRFEGKEYAIADGDVVLFHFR